MLSKFGLSTPIRVPTEVEEAILKWCNEDEMERQGELLASQNLSCPNNVEQQNEYNNIMNSIDEFRNFERDLLTNHQCILLADLAEWENLHCLENYTLHVAARVC